MGGPRRVAWRRFTGDFAVAGQTEGTGVATLGVTGDQCDCCERRRVVIAAVAEDGREIGIGLSLESALEVGEAIIAETMRQMAEAGIERVKPS